MKRKPILIVGRTPPPIGGVTIHVERLLNHLNYDGLNYDFIELSKANIFKVLFRSIFFNKIHLHSSNVYLRLFFALYFFILKKESIVTFHGNLGRYDWLKNKLDNFTVRFSDVPIVLNRESYQLAQTLNESSRLVTAFLPPKKESSIKDFVTQKIRYLESLGVKKTYCTNAYDVSYDKKGEEIYSISKLVELFNNFTQYGLIVSDPSGNYEKYIKRHFNRISSNIVFIAKEHSFFNVLKNIDGFIRATTTDGDSLSVRESLYLGKETICSNVVDRPKGVLTFDINNFSQLKGLIKSDEAFVNPPNNEAKNAYNSLKEIYTH